MSANQFGKAWATGTGANTYDPITYAANTTLNQGVQDGQADPTLFNTTLRQSSSIVAMIAQFMADHQSGDVLDNGNIAALEAQFLASIQGSTGYTRYATATDVGTADALSATTAPIFQTLVAGQLIEVVKGSLANATTTPTFAVNGLSPKQVFKPNGSALAAGDLPANTALLFVVDANLNFRLITTGIVLSDVLSAAQSQVSLNVLADGCCSLSVVDVNHIVLKPKNGNTLFVGGAMQVIPSAGVTASTVVNSLPATANTLYYVYAQMVSGSMTLQLSTTGYTLDAASGRNYKTGDTTQRLVGMVYTNGSGQFQDAPAFRGLLNWFNQRDLLLDFAVPSTTFACASTYSTSTPNVVNVGSITFLCWATSITRVQSNLSFQTTNPNVGNSYTNLIDGTVTTSGQFSYQYITSGTQAETGYLSNYGLLSEGSHTLQAQISSIGAVNGASSTVTGEVFGIIKG